MTETTPYGERPPSPELQKLRVEAEDRVRAERWQDLLELSADLQADTELWPHLWAPASAIAAHHAGRADALDYLDRAVALGFTQPELFEGALADCFGDDPRWPSLQDRMQATPPAPVELEQWPTTSPGAPLRLERQPEGREEELAARLPAPLPSAWDTARLLLSWVHRRWTHSNDHVPMADALAVLDAVEAGRRFACVEYSIVLTQALNAVRIPARRVSLLQAGYHAGVGRGHVVSEAWIDELGRWVLLDGQNGCWWTDDDGQPLGTQALHARHRSASIALMVSDGELSDADPAIWFTYFAASTTTGIGCSTGSFVPVFQGDRVVKTPLLVTDPALVEPDLGGLQTSIVDAEGPAVVLRPIHPYATGVAVGEGRRTTTLPLPTPTVPLTGAPGTHRLQVATTTPYATLASRPLVFCVDSAAGTGCGGRV